MMQRRDIVSGLNIYQYRIYIFMSWNQVYLELQFRDTNVTDLRRGIDSIYFMYSANVVLCKIKRNLALNTKFA